MADEDKCKKCGECCKYILITPHYSYDEDIDWLNNHKIELGPELIKGKKSIKINHPCKYLRDDCLCGIYGSRPQICRDGGVGVIPECPYYEKKGE